MGRFLVSRKRVDRWFFLSKFSESGSNHTRRAPEKKKSKGEFIDREMSNQKTIDRGRLMRISRGTKTVFECETKERRDTRRRRRRRRRDTRRAWRRDNKEGDGRTRRRCVEPNRARKQREPRREHRWLDEPVRFRTDYGAFSSRFLFKRYERTAPSIPFHSSLHRWSIRSVVLRASERASDTELEKTNDDDARTRTVFIRRREEAVGKKRRERRRNSNNNNNNRDRRPVDGVMGTGTRRERHRRNRSNTDTRRNSNISNSTVLRLPLLTRKDPRMKARTRARAVGSAAGVDLASR